MKSKTMNRTTTAFAAGLLAMSALAAMPASASAQAARFVSMGSSYAAGPGVGRPDPASGGCARSLTNYARTVAAHRHLDLVDVSCSGATTDNVLDHGQHGFPAQIEAVTADTQLVSILIGGNDVAYVGDLYGFSCRFEHKDKCGVSDTATLEKRFAELPAKLDRVIAAVRARAPHARVVLVGYLPALPAAAGATQPLCAALPLAPADAQRMRDTMTRLTRVFESTAARNHVDLVPAASISAGHDACAPANYITGYHPARTPGWKEPVAYHPTQAGMDRIALAFERVLDR
ncbi:SGNH/GDSL hydrolase family protein [Massilia sp. 9096]|uniref:SGNH/GDSL hydrolase family protein n=1 Tax=Massilia sp. 9096 TaxID=1500894 RepID=UPI00068AF6A5|nr:SGNH/GDSL hydrolase family protein [Massilia sp. 9096]